MCDNLVKLLLHPTCDISSSGGTLSTNAVTPSTNGAWTTLSGNAAKLFTQTSINNDNARKLAIDMSNIKSITDPALFAAAATKVTVKATNLDLAIRKLSLDVASLAKTSIEQFSNVPSALSEKAKTLTHEVGALSSEFANAVTLVTTIVSTLITPTTPITSETINAAAEAANHAVTAITVLYAKTYNLSQRFSEFNVDAAGVVGSQNGGSAGTGGAYNNPNNLAELLVNGFLYKYDEVSALYIKRERANAELAIANAKVFFATTKSALVFAENLIKFYNDNMSAQAAANAARI